MHLITAFAQYKNFSSIVVVQEQISHVQELVQPAVGFVFRLALLQQIAIIVRGADTDSFQLAPQAADYGQYQQDFS